MVNKLIKKSQQIIGREQRSILSAAMVIAVLTAASALLGLMRNRLLASYFFGGAEGSLDVYFAAFVVPDTLLQLLVTGALSAAFIPVYSEKLKRSNKEANDLASAMITWLFMILFGLTVVLMIFAKPISGLISNFGVEETALMARLMRMMLISQMFFAASAFLTGVIQAHNRFIVPAVAPLVYNMGIILGTILLSKSLGIYGPAIGVVLGAAGHMLVQIPLSLKLGFKFRINWKWREEGVQTIQKLMLPRTATLAVVQMERWVAVNIASMLAAGSLAMFNFARQLYVLPINLFGVSMGLAAFPSLSAEAAEQDVEKFKKILKDALLSIAFFAMPASVILLILRIPTVRIVFGASSFPWQATLLTGRTLALLVISITPQAMTQVLIRAFYALKNTKTPLFVSIMTVGLNVALSFYLAVRMDLGILGLAWGITISDVLGATVLIGLLQRKLGRLELEKALGKMMLATLLTGLALWAPMRVLDAYVFDTTRTAALLVLTGVAGSVGLLTYWLVSYVLKIEQLEAVKKMVNKVGNWRKILEDSDELIETGSEQEGI